MIQYHVYGQVVKEYYHMGYESSFYIYDWYDKSYILDKNSTEDEIFKKILTVQKGLRCFRFYKKQQDENLLTISKPFMETWFGRSCNFVKYKEFKTIITDLELRDNETIRIENKDYRVKYKYNDDKKQNELYIDKIVETIIDEEELKHAKKVCNGVVKKIIKHNKDIKEKKNETPINKEIDNESFIPHKENSFNKSEGKQSRFKNMKLTKIWRNWFR